jgi:ribonuclease D
MFTMSKYLHNSRHLSPPTIVNSAESFDEMMVRLSTAPTVAVDTESNSLYVYAERVCLIQFSVPGEDYLVDPIAIEDVSALGALFADAGTEKVFHAAEYDVMVLRRDYQFEFVHLFDTMVASRIVGWPRYGLGALLEEHFGIRTDKRMQRTDWGKRPLSSAQLAYAQLDTHFLLSLRDKLLAELSAQDRLEEARAAFARVAQQQWKERRFDPDDFWRIKGARELDATGQAVLREMYIYRDQRARVLDRPTFKVLNDQVLLALSRRCPTSLAELGRIKGMPRRLPAKERRRILAVIERGRRAPPPKKPAPARNGRPDEATVSRYEALREWRSNRAKARGVEADVVLSNRTLRSLARHNPTALGKLDEISALTDWERQEYGREIVALLRRQRRFGFR